MEFDWEADKAAINRRKHGISFEEASTAFNDPLAKLYGDERHSQSEDREVLIGESEKRRLLIVFFVDRAGRIRIISARRPTSAEKRLYEERQT
ncbi:MAG: BrnT family toxin [Tepidisphaeraceae bacterium]